MTGTAWVVTPGFSTLPETLRSELASAAVIIAVDGGANLLYDAGIVPTRIVGDMDSIRPEVLTALSERCVVERHPVAKDETDTELALLWCARNDYQDIILVNSLGGRIDQTLGVIFLLEYGRELGLKVHICTGRSELCLAEGEFRGVASPGTPVSLLPLSATVAEVRTEGLLYPLRRETLCRWQTRGISNRVTTGEFTVTHGEGLLLVIVGEE